MTATKKDPWEPFSELQSLLGQIKSLLHGAIASADFFSDKDAEVTLMSLAKESVEEAEKLVESLYKSSLKATAGPAPLAEAKQE
jgi:hypothetical protein